MVFLCAKTKPLLRRWIIRVTQVLRQPVSGFLVLGYREALAQ
jgi:hypothetical protein